MPNSIPTLDELKARAAARQGLQKSLGARLLVCAGTGCLASGAAEVHDELVRLLETGQAPGVTAG
ncbi:MAG: (2Fe-2S) ferredoxin domain-containing protein [Bacillota bacterium]